MAHAAMVAFHFICCGLPIMALLLTAASGATTGALAFSSFAGDLHGFLHSQEALILAASATLVVLGGVLEVFAHRHGDKRGFPWLFALSAACFVFNLSLIVAHRLS